MLKYDKSKTNATQKLRFLEGDSKVSGVQSGGKINMYFVLMDKYN
jgi:hypothetical protein